MDIFSVNHASIFSNAFLLFKGQILPSLNDLQKKILAISTFIFSCFIVYYTITRYYFKAQKSNDTIDDPIIDEQSSKENELNSNKITFDSEGTIYEGAFEFKYDTFNGKGKINRKFGMIDEGEFKDGHLNGNGKRICSSLNRIYEGEFKDGKLNKGKIIYSDGSIYEGEFEDHALKKGKAILPNGRIYEGQFKRDSLHGNGKIISPDGKIEEEGTFEYNRLHGYGKRTYSNGILEEGLFRHGGYYQPKNPQMHGQGRKTSPDGIIFEGQFENDRLDGDGKVILLDGTSFEGKYKEGLLNGPGKITYPDGTVQCYEFKSSVPTHCSLLNYNLVIQVAHHKFADNPEKDKILKRIEEKLANIGYQQSTQPSITFNTEDTLYDVRFFKYSNEEIRIISATTHFLQKLPDLGKMYDK